MRILDLLFGPGDRKRAPDNRLPSRNFDRWRTDRFGVKTPRSLRLRQRPT